MKPEASSWSATITDVLRTCENQIEGLHRRSEIPARPTDKPSVPLGLFILMFVIAGKKLNNESHSLAGYLMYRRRQLTHCSECGAGIRIGLASEESLNSGEAAERKLDSVSHFNKTCTECNHQERLRLFFVLKYLPFIRVPKTKRYRPCPECGYHTKSKADPDAPCVHCTHTTGVAAVTE